MKGDLLRQLKIWRNEQARVEGVEQYRVLSNACVEAIAEAMPETKEALIELKGIKEAKYRQYGKTILALVKAASLSPTAEEARGADTESSTSHNEPLSVAEFLEGVNIELSGLAARIRGEVTSLDIRERVIYFTLKDSTEEGMLQCVIFRYQYQISGVNLAIGDEVIVEGMPEIYKPSGRFSFKTGVIELAGEGNLKKAYDALKAKLEAEGIFAPERKRILPPLAERIALITSSDGAAIGDFSMNVGRNGLSIDFYATAVEGKKAVFEIIKALQYFRTTEKHYDCLVLTRGGGSMESLQAFNNEALVREVAAMPMPVLCGVGHEKDVTLAALAADVMVSTPTAAAKTIALPWEEARTGLEQRAGQLSQLFMQTLQETDHFLDGKTHHLEEHFQNLFSFVRTLEGRFKERLALFPLLLSEIGKKLSLSEKNIGIKFSENLAVSRETLQHFDQALRQYDPERLLALGYSLVRSRETIIRSAGELHPGDRLDIQFGDGAVESEVIKKL